MNASKVIDVKKGVAVIEKEFVVRYTTAGKWVLEGDYTRAGKKKAREYAEQWRPFGFDTKIDTNTKVYVETNPYGVLDRALLRHEGLVEVYDQVLLYVRCQMQERTFATRRAAEAFRNSLPSSVTKEDILER